MATICWTKKSRGWAHSRLQRFALARKSGVLLVKNTEAAQQFAYLTCKKELRGDFVAEFEVRGAIGVGLVLPYKSSYIYRKEVELSSSRQKVRIERTSGKLSVFVNGRESHFSPDRSRSSRSSSRVKFDDEGFLYVRIGKSKTCQIKTFALFEVPGTVPSKASKWSRKKSSRSP